MGPGCGSREHQLIASTQRTPAGLPYTADGRGSCGSLIGGGSIRRLLLIDKQAEQQDEELLLLWLLPMAE